MVCQIRIAAVHHDEFEDLIDFAKTSWDLPNFSNPVQIENLLDQQQFHNDLSDEQHCDYLAGRLVATVIKNGLDPDAHISGSRNNLSSEFDLADQQHCDILAGAVVAKTIKTCLVSECHLAGSRNSLLNSAVVDGGDLGLGTAVADRDDWAADAIVVDADADCAVAVNGDDLAVGATAINGGDLVEGVAPIGGGSSNVNQQLCREERRQEIKPDDVGTGWLPQLLQLLEETDSAFDGVKRGLTAVLSTREMKVMDKAIELQSKRWARDGLPVEGVSWEHSMLLHLYSLESPPIYERVSKILNDTESRTKDESMIGSVLPFTQGFIEACKSKGRGKSDLVYRIVNYSYDDRTWKQKFKVGKDICWYTVKSLSVDREVMAEMAKPGPSTIFIVEDCITTDISMFSAFSEEGEVITLPGVQLKVVDKWRSKSADSPDVWERADVIRLHFMDSADEP